MSQSAQPVVVFHGNLRIAQDLHAVLERGGVQAWTVPLPGG